MKTPTSASVTAHPKIELQYTTIQSPLPSFVYDDMKPFVETANTYHPVEVELVEAICKKHDVPRENIFPCAGINEAIHLLMLAYGTNSYVFTPTYTEYKWASNLGGKFTEIPSMTDNKFSISAETISDATIIFLANPNNPFGWTEVERVLELIRNNSHSIVVVDEAYGEFSDLSVLDQVPEYKNLVVLRSFSKSYGMASARVGYAVGSPEILTAMKNKAPWSNVSHLAAGSAVSALSHEEYFETMRDKLCARREKFQKVCDEAGYTIIPSKINAVTLKFSSKKEADEFVSYLSENMITVNQGNGVANIGLDDSYVRIAIGTEGQMDIVEDVVKKYKKAE